MRGSGNPIKTLLILRHAKSSWADQALDDHGRPLNARGERDAPRMGALVREERLSPELVISSDALRARQTSEAMAAAAGYTEEIILDPRLYHASVGDIVEVLRSVASDTNTVMIVGHNPGLEQLIAQLTGEHEDFPTAALARVVLPVDRWSDLRTTTRGTLVGLWRPKEMAG